VKARVAGRTDDEMLHLFPRRARTPNWFLRVKEVSAGHYVVTARDRWGREVSHEGGEADVSRMIEECERFAEAARADR
jgi:hypothetical protein